MENYRGPLANEALKETFLQGDLQKKGFDPAGTYSQAFEVSSVNRLHQQFPDLAEPSRDFVLTKVRKSNQR